MIKISIIIMIINNIINNNDDIDDNNNANNDVRNKIGFSFNFQCGNDCKYSVFDQSNS